MKVKLRFKGADLDTLKLPNFASQKSFKEAFRFSDLPPVGKPEQGTKEFIVEIRPMDVTLKEIPPFEFTYFDPETEQYKLLKSESIPISVRKLEKPNLKAPSEPIESKKEASLPSTQQDAVALEQTVSAPPPIEIAGLFKLEDQKIKNFDQSTKFLFWPWAVALGLLFAQWLMKNKIWIKRKTESEKIFFEARNYSREPQKFLLLLEKAFLARLIEEGWLQKEETLERLSEEGLNGEIKSFIDELYHQLFSGHAHFEFEKSWKQAKQLFKRIGEAR